MLSRRTSLCGMKRFPRTTVLTTMLLAILIVSGVSPVHAGGSDKKKNALSLRIHGETGAEEGEKFAVPVTLLDGRRTAVSIMPLLSEHDIRSVFPFHAQDGTYGVYLTLDGHGANLLTSYSVEHMGRNNVLVVMLDGRHVTDIIVDKPVCDGVFPISGGLTIVEAAKFVNAYPVTGHEREKSQKGKKPKFQPGNIMLPPKAADLQGATAP